MKDSKTFINIPLIALFSLLAFSRHSPADLIDPDPVRLLEAQQMALDLSGQLRPPAELTEQIYNDLAAIRSSYPEFADITYRPHATPYEVIVGLTQEAAEQFRNGEFHGLDEFNELYGPVTIGPLRGSDRHPYVILQFEQVYNTELLSDIYEQAEGVRYAEPNYMIGDGSTIDPDPPFYTFILAWGDCPAGCIYREFHHFKVEDGRVTIPDERYVDALDGNDDNYGLTPEKAFATIQAAIDVAVDGDTVIVADGTYTGDGNRDIDFLGKAITVRSESGPENCIIDCNGSESEPHRGFYFHSSETDNSILAGVTVEHGYWPSVIYDGGGAVSCDQSSPTISECVFRENRVEHAGGAINNKDCSSHIYGCTFIDNVAVYGGAIWNLWNCNVSIVDCTFRNNTAYGSGAIRNTAGSNTTIVGCTFYNNKARVAGGGAISYGECDSATIINCAIVGNSAGWYGYGGGLAFFEVDDVVVSNCTIVGNAALKGRAIGFDSANQCCPSNATMTNCILWDGVEGIWNNDNSAITVIYSNVSGGWEGLGNIDLDPCFVEVGYWDMNGTPDDVNDDLWIDGDYHLLPNSPCIDAGDPNYTPEPNETDLDGKPRVIGARIDMGAYEYEPVAAIEAVIKIGPRTLNLRSKGKWIMCLIRLAEDYDVADMKPNSVSLEDEIEAERVWLGDGFAVAKFSRTAVKEMLGEVETPAEVELVVSGELTDGTIFEGTDTIRVIDKGKGRNNPPGKVVKRAILKRK